MAKNEAQTDINLFNYLTNDKKFSEKWKAKKIANSHIVEALRVATKSDTGQNRGEPDLIYFNKNRKILILVENKDSIKDHNGNNIRNNATAGIKHYLKFFLQDKLKERKETTQKFLTDFKIIGVAFSGNIAEELNHLIDTFIIQNDKIKDISIKEFLNENDYISLFENLDLELIANNISKSSSVINNMLRNIDSQKRPVLLSALMICLYEKDNVQNDFKGNYQNYQTSTIINHIPTTIQAILIEEGISQSKINVLTNELSFITADNDLNNSNILSEILEELEKNVIPLFNKNASYDIIGKFYEEFLRYAGIANVKKGIVLTPNHITTLFTQLIPVKSNDNIFDACCGTGAFLISGMNKLIDSIAHSNVADKTKRINNVKQNQLLGFEKNNTMYSLAISNMLFRGDGKSRIHNIDFFSDDALSILKTEKPTVGFINPPYGGLDNKKNPTKKEIQFLEKMLDSVRSYGVIIAPQSVFFKDGIIRDRILTKHTLKAVINMPKELFQPNASTHTAIGIFETHSSHGNKKVVFYDLKDDGFALSKNKGRTDVYNKWSSIKNNLLKKLKNPQKYNNNTNLVYKSIKNGDEWILQAHQKTDYSTLNDDDFIKSIKEYIVFKIKLDLDLFDKKIDEISMLEILNRRNISADSILEIDNENKAKDVTYNNPVIYPKNTISLNSVEWQEFKISDLFYVVGTKTTSKLTLYEYGCGNYPYITTRATNNGVDGFYNYYTEKGNVLTIDSATIGHTTYQETDFSASDHVEKLIPICHKKMNKYVALFFKTILNKEQYRYDYGRKFNQNRIKATIIKLPIASKDLPNWQFMEDYNKSLPYSKSL